ncbi:MAG: hypothetical protein RIQ93_1205 [Verrucomicrobiota bacterium]|jgi:hypothetical protein
MGAERAPDMRECHLDRTAPVPVSAGIEPALDRVRIGAMVGEIVIYFVAFALASDRPPSFA